MADALRFIKDIHPQLREKLIYREYINQKYTAKKAQGWDEVHKSLKAAPYCEHNQQIVKVLICEECADIAGNYRCDLCHINRQNHYIDTHLNKSFVWPLSSMRCYVILRAAYIKNNPSDKRSPKTFRKTCRRENSIEISDNQIYREAYQQHLLEFYPTSV